MSYQILQRFWLRALLACLIVSVGIITAYATLHRTGAHVHAAGNFRRPSQKQ